ncbi:hypothetical protein NQ176_g4565 [Zarea fungicola]|uniref:Uncharacterized protein n=1 Tax=Zarea fungicola TaxID=93591 RepID=A0ACC1NDJ1_9HYPO|nr:hypothetical protein NQ176_g4565 [Lecanicillium fungicola]
MTTILVLGGAGAQNSAVVRELAKNPSFRVKVLSRNIESEECVSLAALDRVTLSQGDCYNEEHLVAAFKNVDSCFVNTNGFAIGEKAETYWAIRMYEIAYFSGVKHFVFSSLPYVSKKSGFNPKYRVPFADGKGKVVDYLRSQPTDKMNWSALETGPYPDSFLNSYAPTQADDGAWVFRMPIGRKGAMPFIALSELAWYARHILENPQTFAGDLLSVAIAHVSGDELAAAFSAVTGQPARFEPFDLLELSKTWPTAKVGAAGLGYEDPTLVTMAGHMIPWFTIWQESGGNTGLWTKDYARLDKIHPGRIKTIEEWMRKSGYSTEKRKHVLKTGMFNAPSG